MTASNVIKLFTVVRCERCARIVNYNHKLHSKLKCTFTIVNYDPKPFIVQATGVFCKKTFQCFQA
jgi:hypothetical protein